MFGPSCFSRVGVDPRELMLTQKFRERTDTVSFRIGSGIRLSLEEEAKKSGVSLNTLVSQIFTYHTGWGRYARRLKLIPLSKDHLRELYQFMPKDKIQEIAKRLAETAGVEHILFLFQRIDLPSLMEFVEIWGNHFDAYEHRFNGKTHFYTLHHDVNLNFSHFIKEYMTALLQSTISKVPRFESISPNAVTFSFEG